MAPANILVIDDEILICKACVLILEEHQINYCTTGQAGSDEIRRGSYDLLLLDIKLPDLDGMEILRTVHETKPTLQVVIMTGHSTVQNAVEAMKLGAFDYLTKPFTDDQLINTVKNALERKRLVEENLSLRKELFDRFSFENIIGDDPKIIQVFRQIEKVAPTESTVLLYGESGTGKELFAGAIHTHSQRAFRQIVPVDCSALSPNLLESELFGHVKGAFTGALRDKEGLFEVAGGGTLFMDDVTNLDLEIQAKLLRVLESGEYKPVGATHLKKTDIRIIAATNRDLKKMVEEGKFREDLFYRLNVFPIDIPPLRERKEDIPKLAYYFLKLFSRKTGKIIEGFSDEALEVLINYEWPGNVRQLKNIIERLVILAEDRTLGLPYLLDHMHLKRAGEKNSVPETLQELKAAKSRFLTQGFDPIEKAFLLKALRSTKGNITQAARKVGMQRSNFCLLLRKHHLSSDNLNNEFKGENLEE